MRMAIAKDDCPPLSVIGNRAAVAFGPGAHVDLDLVIAETEDDATGPGRRMTLADCLGEHVRHLEAVAAHVGAHVGTIKPGDPIGASPTSGPGVLSGSLKRGKSAAGSDGEE